MRRVVLQVPDTAGRYYVLQFVSAWTENFAHVEKRATGTASGRFVIAGPDWERSQDGSTMFSNSVIRTPESAQGILATSCWRAVSVVSLLLMQSHSFRAPVYDRTPTALGVSSHRIVVDRHPPLGAELSEERRYRPMRRGGAATAGRADCYR